MTAWNPLVSVIIPIHNGEKWINDCFESILKQDVLKKEKVEISVYNDSSQDESETLLINWQKKINSLASNLTIILTNEKHDSPKGVGYSRNVAVEQSKGEYLCFQDVDDEMLPSRISKQLAAASQFPNAIIGCQVKRTPENSTTRFTNWANNLEHDLLTVQIYTSHGPTVLMPTWFFHRSVYNRVGKFSEVHPGIPEDLIFFYRHLDVGGKLHRVNEILVNYRYHPSATTFSVSEETIWNIRLERLENVVLAKWNKFTIWNAGKQGRKFYRQLTDENRNKVVCFCDVDKNKVGKFYEPYPKLKSGKDKVEILHFTQAQPPFVVCVKLDLTDGQFEINLKSLNLKEGKDYVLFS